MATKTKAAKQGIPGFISPELYQRDDRFAWVERASPICPARLKVGDEVYQIYFDRTTGEEVWRLPAEIVEVPANRKTGLYRIRIPYAVACLFGSDASGTLPISHKDPRWRMCIGTGPQLVMVNGHDLDYNPPHDTWDTWEKG